MLASRAHSTRGSRFPGPCDAPIGRPRRSNEHLAAADASSAVSQTARVEPAKPGKIKYWKIHMNDNRTNVLFEDLRERLVNYTGAVKRVEGRLDAMNAPPPLEGKSLRDTLRESESLSKLFRDKSGSAVFELTGRARAEFDKKTILESGVGAQTTGVMPIHRIPGVVPEARQVLSIRDLLPQRPTTQLVIDFAKVDAPMAIASPQTEGSAKASNTATFTTASQQIRTIATYTTASKQILDDLSDLMAFLQGSLAYAVGLATEIQILSGDNTGSNLNGLITQATAFDTSLLSAPYGWNRIDILGRAIQQIQASKEVAPSFFVVHPSIWWAIRLTKDSYGHYLTGPPMMPAGTAVTGGVVAGAPTLFGLTPVVTTCMSEGNFLVGSGDPACVELRVRSGLQIEIATQHASDFTANLVTIRCEERLALVCFRPGSYIYGSIATTSPAG